MFVWQVMIKQDVWLNLRSPSFSCRKKLTSSSPQQLTWKFVTPVLGEEAMNWRHPHVQLHFFCIIHSVQPLPASRRSYKIATSGQRNVCVRLSSGVWLCLSIFGLNYEAVSWVSSLTLWDALLYLNNFNVSPCNGKASWVGKRFRSSGSQMKGTSRWVWT